MNSKKLALACAFVFGLTFAVQVYAVCDGAKVAACMEQHPECDGSDTAPAKCEIYYYNCLRISGCPIP